MRIPIILFSFCLPALFSLLIIPINGFSQLSYHSNEPVFNLQSELYVSNIAYKLPFRGENYKFYGTLSYHIYGKAYASCDVHNAIVEAFNLCDRSECDAKFKILKSSRRKNGKLLPLHSKKNGRYTDFMTPLLKNGEPIKAYYRTGLFRFFTYYNTDGVLKSNDKVEIDFENMALFIINLDNASEMYGLRIKKIIFNRFLLDELFSTSLGEELKSRDIYFAKFLSDKVNRKYDDIFYVEFADKY